MLAMPSPRKVVRQSVAVCRRNGMTRIEALNTVIRCCDTILAADSTGSIPLEGWIYEIKQTAEKHLYRQYPGTIQDWRA